MEHTCLGLEQFGGRDLCDAQMEVVAKDALIAITSIAITSLRQQEIRTFGISLQTGL